MCRDDHDGSTFINDKSELDTIESWGECVVKALQNTNGFTKDYKE